MAKLRSGTFTIKEGLIQRLHGFTLTGGGADGDVNSIVVTNPNGDVIINQTLESGTSVTLSGIFPVPLEPGKYTIAVVGTVDGEIRRG